MILDQLIAFPSGQLQRLGTGGDTGCSAAFRSNTAATDNFSPGPRASSRLRRPPGWLGEYARCIMGLDTYCESSADKAKMAESSNAVKDQKLQCPFCTDVQLDERGFRKPAVLKHLLHFNREYRTLELFRTTEPST